MKHCLMKLAVLAIIFCWPGLGLAVSAKTGFLIIAPDRGFLGNQETQAIFQEFKKGYTTSLAFVGRDYNGVGSEYSGYISQAVGDLKRAGVTQIVAIPLFLSSSDPVFKKVIPYLPSYVSGSSIQWAAPMQESHLTSQILLDRVRALSRDPEQERLVVLATGAMDEESGKMIEAELEPLAQYVKRYLPLKEVEIGIYYDRDAAKEVREKKNQAVDDLVTRMAAKKGQALVVPFFIGPKFDGHMAMTQWISDKFKDLDIVYQNEEIMPHPNILLWLKKTANQYLPVSSTEIGVVIMPHGATQPWNDAVEQAIAPLKSRYKIEMAYGMADPSTIQQAISRLENQGVKRIVFVRMYALSHQMKEMSDWILGISDTPPGRHDNHGHHSAPPHQVRSATVFSTLGGYEENPDISQILHERIMELSQDPAKETVILVAHGEGDDEGNAKWLSVMMEHTDRIKTITKSRFRAIKAATVREDWPEKRKQAVAQLKELIQEGNHGGRVLLISNRLYGAGPYKRLLEDVGLREGTDYVMNGKGFAPHPILTRWLETNLQLAIKEMSNGPTVKQASDSGAVSLNKSVN